MWADDPDTLELIGYTLARHNFDMIGVDSGEEAFASVRKSLPDLVVLDLMLPGIDGLEVCRRLKNDNRTAAVPVIILSAKGEEADVVIGLELGADDYLTKPFSPRVLMARIKAVLRRKGGESGTAEAVIKHQDLRINAGRHEVLVAGAPVQLTLTEFRILYQLARRPGWVFTRNQILEAAQGDETGVTQRAVDVHMVALRRKLGSSGDLVETIRGVGYRLRE
ncbi:MAG: response regulator transcription factor [Candidatus Tectomicrobia bacterium]|nr:response regulator transcription factor [Candidatus Tectomicrobia bacterium]